ncbi:hypothetical protein BU25DRAFT_218431 [Macroventuria anomochaeta]|uniref:Uncharacterized protein n=1 Tax=Macroventuria anomochaeta TaxID=301207 RepID=A0ACB6RJ99_9PLEO|nr:uncharacterized protein BU25DRAFT_218431 [Macroventuria anomochaeta]KAF2622071.1 hypothetical protein BU25DRAFT_218431 [Macroventuria anomochaeta]
MDTIKFLNLTSSIIAAISAPYNSTSATSPLTARQVSGTGPYAPTTTSNPLLPMHTIYQPANLFVVADSVPVIIWGNSICNTMSGDPYKTLNEELASWGMMVLACGEAASALNTVESQAGKDAWEKVDKEKVGMLGTSCAGADLYTAAEDPRVLSLAILDTGKTSSTAETRAMAANTTKPVFYFSTASTDTGLVSLDHGASGVRADFNAVAKGVPTWYGVLPGTDVEMLSEGSAGKMGRAGRFWAQWMVGGNQSSSEFFVDAAGAESEGWTVVRKGMDVLVS